MYPLGLRKPRQVIEESEDEDTDNEDCVDKTVENGSSVKCNSINYEYECDTIQSCALIGDFGLQPSFVPRAMPMPGRGRHWLLGNKKTETL